MDAAEGTRCVLAKWYAETALRVCDRVQSVELLAKLRKPFQNMQHSSLDFAERHALVEFGGRAVTSIQLDFLAITRHRLISLPTTI